MDEELDLVSAIKDTPFYEAPESANEVPQAPTQEPEGKSESEPENATEEPTEETAPEEGTTEDTEGEGEPKDTEEDDPEVEITVEGKQEKVKLSELKSSYLRHADYTRKTQDLAESRRSLEQKQAEQQEAYNRLSEVLTQATQKLQEITEAAPSVKLRAELNAVDVASLTPEQLQEYQRASAICDQMARKEAEQKAQYEKVRADAIKEFETRDKARMQEDFNTLRGMLPELATPESGMKLGQELTSYMNEIYGKERAEVVLSNIRTKEDFLTAYYAMKGYKLSKTNVKADAEEKAKTFKAGQQANSQTIKPQKDVRQSILNKVHAKGERSEISDDDLIAYLSK